MIKPHIKLLLILFLLIAGLSACGNDDVQLREEAGETGSTDAYLEADANLQPQPGEPTSPMSLDRTPALLSVSNRTQSLTVSNIGVVSGCGGGESDAIIAHTLSPQSRNHSASWYNEIVNFPSVAFMYETDAASGRAVLASPLSHGNPHIEEVSVSFVESDSLYAVVEKTFASVAEPLILSFRYNPLLGQWLEVRRGQSLFAVGMSSEEYLEMFPGAEWDSFIWPVVFFTHQPIFDLRFIHAEDDFRDGVWSIVEKEVLSQYDIFLPGQHFARAMDHVRGVQMYMRYIDNDGIERVQTFHNSEVGGFIPFIATNMLEQSETLLIEPLADTQTWRQNSAFEIFAEINNIDDSSTFGVANLSRSANQEAISRIQNLGQLEIGESGGDNFLVVPRYENSVIIVQTARGAHSFNGFEHTTGSLPGEVIYHIHGTPQDYALMISAPASWETVLITVAGGGQRARYVYTWGLEYDILFPLPYERSRFFEEPGIQSGSVFDVPLAHDAMLRFSSKWSGIVESPRAVDIVLGSGELLLLSDGGWAVPSFPAVSPARDRLAYISNIGWEVIGDLYIFDVAAETHTRSNIEGYGFDEDRPYPQWTHSWAWWLDDSYLLVGGMFAFGTVTAGGNIYLHSVPEDVSFMLFEGRGGAEISGIELDGDMATIHYSVWECPQRFRNEIRERTISVSDIHALIETRRVYVIDGEENR